MKVLLFICFCLVLPLTGRQLENDVALHPGVIYSSQKAQPADENKQGTGQETVTKKGSDKPTAHDAKTNFAGEKQGIGSLFSYFLEPEFAGILLLVAVVGLSGMKHAD